MPFGSDLIQSQRKLFRYEWIWRKNLGTGFLNAKKMPLKCHENILVFYRRLPTYNPQWWYDKPYKGEHRRIKKSPYREGIGGHTLTSDGKRYPIDVQEFCSSHSGGRLPLHSTEKPVDLLEYLIKTYSNEGELILDATMGSGSTGVAAVNTGRRFIGFETEEKFFNIAEKRINEALAKRQQELF